MAEGAPPVQAERDDNLLVSGGVRSGNAAKALGECDALAEGVFEVSFVEHAYIEPEAGWARRIGDRIEVHVSTQTPYMDRDEVANILQVAGDQVRIVPTACGGGFGGKLDQGVQPLIALAAWLTGRPVACVWTRPESMAASTKRHPSRITTRFGCDRFGRMTAAEMFAEFNTGAYASWGPTVSGRVPIHGMGPYRVPHVRTRGRAWFANEPPAGAFRGFGVPQAAIAHETMMDDLSLNVGIDRLEFRLMNALTAGDRTATGQLLEASAGLPACLEALTQTWKEALAQAETKNVVDPVIRRGVGIGCMWYGIGNTSMTNPSTMRIGLSAGGQVTFYNGAADIGQGSSTILTQIAADALGVPVDTLDVVVGDTDRTADAGKSSASRQTFVSGKATELAGLDLRTQILRLANAGDDARLSINGGTLTIVDGDAEHTPDLAGMAADANGDVLIGDGTFDPPATALDEHGQGSPYATYAFAAQIAVVDVDTELGTVKVKRMVAAHDVGRAINPIQVEGQIHGGIAQGLGLALMEEYVPGVTENLHDYLIPTFGDMPEIAVIIIEDEEPLGPYRRQGHRRAGLVADGAGHPGRIRHATGARITRLPGLTPDRVRAAIVAEPQRVTDPRRPDQGRAGIVKCATPARCCAVSGRARTGACDRYGNADGRLVRVDPLVVAQRVRRAWRARPFLEGKANWDGAAVAGGKTSFVTGIGSGTTYPDYKPAPFIVSSEARRRRHGDRRLRGHLQLLRHQGEDRHRPLLRARAGCVLCDGEPIGHVTTAEYGSQMLALGGVRHLTGGSKKEGNVTCQA